MRGEGVYTLFELAMALVVIAMAFVPDQRESPAKLV